MSVVLASGTYTIRQKSSGRLLDAYETADKDFGLVTRPAQNNDTQRWSLAQIGTVLGRIRQKSSGRYVTSLIVEYQDKVVTHEEKGLRWLALATASGSVPSSAGIMNPCALRVWERLTPFMTVRGDEVWLGHYPESWLLDEIGPDTFTIRREFGGHFLDAYQTGNEVWDFGVVIRPPQNNDTQRWLFKVRGALYTIIQKSNGRFIDAYETADKDFGLVTRPAQNNDTQRWLILPAPGGSFKFRQLSSNRFVDAYQSAEDDFSAVTRKHQHNDTQRWLFDPA